MKVQQLLLPGSKYDGKWFIATDNFQYLHSDGVVRDFVIHNGLPTGYYDTEDAAYAMLSPQIRANHLGRALCPVNHGTHTDYVPWEPGMPTRNLIVPEVEYGYWWAYLTGENDARIVQVGPHGVQIMGDDFECAKHFFTFLQKVNNYVNV